MATYNELINVEDFGDKKNEFNLERGNVSFYCKDCEEMVKATRPNPKGYTFVCPKCKGKNISIGTQEGIKDNYRIN